MVDIGGGGGWTGGKASSDVVNGRGFEFNLSNPQRNSYNSVHPERTAGTSACHPFGGGSTCPLLNPPFIGFSTHQKSEGDKFKFIQIFTAELVLIERREASLDSPFFTFTTTVTTTS